MKRYRWSMSMPGNGMIEDDEGGWMRYSDFLAEKDAWRDNKRDLENDNALKMEQIAMLEAELKEKKEEILLLVDQSTSIIHDQSAENILLKKKIADETRKGTEWRAT